MKIYKNADIGAFEEKLREAKEKTDRIIRHFDRVLYSVQDSIDPKKYFSDVVEMPFIQSPEFRSKVLIIEHKKYEELFSANRAVVRRLADKWLEDWERYLLKSFVDEKAPPAPSFAIRYIKTNIYTVKPLTRELSDDPSNVVLEGLQVYREDLYSVRNVYVNIYNFTPLQGFIYVIKGEDIYEFEIFCENARWYFIDPDEKDFIADKAVFEAKKEYLKNVVTVSEAAQLTGYDETTIRRDILSGKFVLAEEVRKSGRTWLITREALKRVYGKEV